MESRTETPHEVLLINGLAKLTNDPFVQGADPGVGIMISSHEDRWNVVQLFTDRERGARGGGGSALCGLRNSRKMLYFLRRAE
jgi:hypothetical protein